MSVTSFIKLFGLLGFILLRSFPATAHVSADMPDPIAEIEYQMILDFEPDNLLTRYKLAMVYYRLEKDKEAETELQTILKKDPNNFLALEGLGMLLVRHKKYERAITTLVRASQHEERDSGTYYYLGKALLGVGKKATARAALIDGLKLHSKEPEKKRSIKIEQFNDLLATVTPEINN